jgi:hypothetical protein
MLLRVLPWELALVGPPAEPAFGGTSRWSDELGALPTATGFIGPSANGGPLEVGVVDDADGVAIIYAMPARSEFLKGW